MSDPHDAKTRPEGAVDCASCNGAGLVASEVGSIPHKCKQCKGEGWILRPHRAVDCLFCSGVAGLNCQFCKGVGWILPPPGYFRAEPVKADHLNESNAIQCGRCDGRGEFPDPLANFAPGICGVCSGLGWIPFRADVTGEDVVIDTQPKQVRAVIETHKIGSVRFEDLNDWQFQTEVDYELARIRELLLQKRASYGQGNLTWAGWRGIVLRMVDKSERMKTMFRKNEAVAGDGEALDETFRDELGYSILGRIFLRTNPGE